MATGKLCEEDLQNDVSGGRGCCCLVAIPAMYEKGASGSTGVAIGDTCPLHLGKERKYLIFMLSISVYLKLKFSFFVFFSLDHH